ncbi:MAG: Omp28 family outer membrane lipoprotein [Tannerellaceae bacterium]|jgi:hypothetical protein|nr:Omp28 family outer membrane lipoprotein [Tannerellaceae bacterium]
MKKKNAILCLLIISCWGFKGCDLIPEDQRRILMDEVIPLKRVLLADFTDQDCINCPNAAIEIKKLKALYGDALTVVSIHASTRNRPLVTEEGNTYDAHFKTNETGHPAGVIDGSHISINYDQWGGLILQQFNTESWISLHLSTDYKAGNREVNISAQIKGKKRASQLNLLLWAVESKVVSWQKMPDNTTEAAYEHMHVFRSALNGIWGETFSMEAEEEKEIKNTYILDEKWKAEQVSIVGFVFDPHTDEVFDVSEVYVLKQ